MTTGALFLKKFIQTSSPVNKICVSPFKNNADAWEWSVKIVILVLGSFSAAITRGIDVGVAGPHIDITFD